VTGDGRDDRYVRAWRETAVKRGLAVGALAGARGDAFAATLAAASLALPGDADLAERDVNERLRAWLAGPGAMLGTDHVELRRWLCDLGLVGRDGYGRAYRRASPPPAAYAAAVAAMASIDPAAVASEARDAHARERAARRARHEAAQDR
jgi:hypothetical protein